MAGFAALDVDAINEDNGVVHEDAHECIEAEDDHEAEVFAEEVEPSHGADEDERKSDENDGGTLEGIKLADEENGDDGKAGGRSS